MAYFDRTYRGIRDALELALVPGHFPVFTRSKNPNRLEGTRTGLTLQALAPFGVVDVPLWRPEDVPHGPDGYAFKAPTKRDIAVAIRALRRCLHELKKEWEAFCARRCFFVVSGGVQVKVIVHVPEMAAGLEGSCNFYPCKWIMNPGQAYSALARAVKAAGKDLGSDAFKTVVEIAASASALDFAANESPEHRKARVDVLKATIAKESEDKRAARIRNLDAKLKSPESQAALKAKYHFTIGRRTRDMTIARRMKRFLKRSLETPEELLQRAMRHAKHLENWHASRKSRTPEQRAIERSNRQASWKERRPRQRATKADRLVANMADLDAVTRAYHYKDLTGYRNKGDIRADPIGARLMAFYDENPDIFKEDQKAFTASVTAKAKEKNYASQNEYEERKRIEKWGPDHANLTRGEKLKRAYASNRAQKEEAARVAAEAASATGVPEEPPKDKWASQKLYRERKKKEAADLAAGRPLEPAVKDPKLIERGQKIAAAWARKRAAKEAGLAEEPRNVVSRGASSSSSSA